MQVQLFISQGHLDTSHHHCNWRLDLTEPEVACILWTFWSLRLRYYRYYTINTLRNIYLYIYLHILFQSRETYRAVCAVPVFSCQGPLLFREVFTARLNECGQTRFQLHHVSKFSDVIQFCCVAAETFNFAFMCTFIFTIKIQIWALTI